MKHVVECLVMLCAVCLLLGCSFGPPKPDGFPKDIVPCVLTFTQEGQPLSEAIISLVPDSEDARNWSAGGMTKGDGTVKVYTYGKWEGIPLGTYKIIVVKSTVEDRPGGREVVIHLVNTDLMDAKTTPLTLEVKGKTAQTFEVGPAPARSGR